MPSRAPALRRLSRAVNRLVLPLVRSLRPRSLVVLETRGRRTGEVHAVVLPAYVRTAEGLFLVSAYGEGADWVRNVLADPRVRVRGTDAWEGTARPVPLDALRDVLEAGELPGPRLLDPLTRAFVLAWARLGLPVRVRRS